MHIDASGIALEVVLAQLGEKMGHPVYCATRKLSTAENNYTTTEREALAMVYSLLNFRHYLLGAPFKFFTENSTLKYLVNKPILEGRICKWLLLFQEFTFEVVIKPSRLSAGPNHLSRLEIGESDGAIDDRLLDVDLFRIEAIPNHLQEIATLLTKGSYPLGYIATPKRHLVVREVDYQLIAGHLYKMGLDQILRCCFLQHEREDILWECHVGVVGGHGGGKVTARKILQAGLWWPIVHRDLKAFANECDVCQRLEGLLDVMSYHYT